MLPQLQSWLINLGLPNAWSHQVSVTVLAAAVLVLSWIAHRITKGLLVRTIRRLVQRSKATWDDPLIEHGVFGRLAHLVPAVIIYSGASIPFPDSPDMVATIKHVALVGMILVGILVIDAMINVGLHLYDRTSVSRERPLKSYAQVLKIVLYVVGGILILTHLLNRSALGLLGGLGAMTAVTLLVFKDSILGFVAGIQLSANDMLHRGDWIEMPKYGADGTVIDVALTTVKVHNWDKTITTIPTYALVSDAFKNWRGMSDSGSRRIKRAINIDLSSIRFCTDAEIARFEKIEYLSDYIEEKCRALAVYNENLPVSTDDPVNGRRLTNLGTYRCTILRVGRRLRSLINFMTCSRQQFPPPVIKIA